MAGPDRSGRRRGRLKLLTGFSVVAGGIAFLLWPRPAIEQPVGRGAPRVPPSAEALGEGFEPQDASARSIALVMAVGALVIALSVGGLFLLLASYRAGDRTGPPLTAQQSATLVPPGPPLQAAPLVDIAVLRSREAAALDRYRWIGPDHAAAEIPIARAMALTVGKPLDPAPASGLGSP